jgi:TPR repeat protein
MSRTVVRLISCTVLLTTALAAQTLTDLERRAANGDHDAQTALGTLYETGDGVPIDLARAVALYREAASAGHVGAQINLATMYLDGAGVTRNAATAVEWLRRAADRGSAFAQLSLGMLFESGDPPVRPDIREAARRYRQAAGQGFMPAQFQLARLYEEGRGLSRDLDEAAALYRKAADQKDPAAQLRLGILLSPGNGARTDVVEAHMWLNLSASRWKNEALRVEAAARRDALEPRMTEAQISEAIRRSLRWQDTVGMGQK